MQYQKGIRLLQTRKLLASGGSNVTSEALNVGYESQSQ